MAHQGNGAKSQRGWAGHSTCTGKVQSAADDATPDGPAPPSWPVICLGVNRFRSHPPDGCEIVSAREALFTWTTYLSAVCSSIHTKNRVYDHRIRNDGGLEWHRHWGCTTRCQGPHQPLLDGGGRRLLHRRCGCAAASRRTCQRMQPNGPMQALPCPLSTGCPGKPGPSPEGSDDPMDHDHALRRCRPQIVHLLCAP
jgi:hypothetical protein